MGFFTNIFKQKEPPALLDFSSIKTDIHSHLIPGIDDGAKTMDESIELIKVQYELGIRNFVTTPHIMSDFFKNTPEIILGGLNELRIVLKQENIDVTINAAAEYYLDEGFVHKLDHEKLLTIGDNYLLFEISYINPPDNLRDVIFKIQTNGYKPILAHPERYPFYYKHFDEYKRIRDSGVLLQINFNSLAGYYGIEAKKIAEQLIDEKMVDLIGSDMHHSRHAHCMRKVCSEKYFYKVAEMNLLNKTLY